MNRKAAERSDCSTIRICKCNLGNLFQLCNSSAVNPSTEEKDNRKRANINAALKLELQCQQKVWMLGLSGPQSSFATASC